MAKKSNQKKDISDKDFSSRVFKREAKEKGKFDEIDEMFEGINEDPNKYMDFIEGSDVLSTEEINSMLRALEEAEKEAEKELSEEEKAKINDILQRVSESKQRESNKLFQEEFDDLLDMLSVGEVGADFYYEEVYKKQPTEIKQRIINNILWNIAKHFKEELFDVEKLILFGKKD